MGKWLRMMIVLLCALALAPRVQAAEAEDISHKRLVVGASGVGSVNPLFDGRTMESIKIRGGGSLTLEYEDGIGSLYLVFGNEYGAYTVMDPVSGEQRSFGQSGFLHEFLDLEETFGYAPKKIKLIFDNGDAKLAELSAFTPGTIPSWVQRWNPPLEGEADLVLFSTHADDEQLFFAGMLPYYGAERGYNVQVVYMTGHRNMSVRRSHEMLDGLWAVGIRNYPVFGPFGDYNSTSKAAAYQTYRNKNISREDILSFVVENVRRFRPKVAVGHDLNGEYGHGMHMIYAELLCEASEISMDREQFPESAEKYGVWDIPKTYLHLYPENQIVMDWDIPLEAFDGMTAFEVTKKRGFPCHTSQQTYFESYFAGKETAADIQENSPCEFGLYRSTVGEDVQKQDFFENVTTYAEDSQAEERLQEEIARAEAEAKERAEAEAREQERLRIEAIAQATAPETEPTQPKTVPEPEEEARKNFAIPVFVGNFFIGVLIFCIFGILKMRKKEK